MSYFWNIETEWKTEGKRKGLSWHLSNGEEKIQLAILREDSSGILAVPDRMDDVRLLRAMGQAMLQIADAVEKHQLSRAT